MSENNDNKEVTDPNQDLGKRPQITKEISFQDEQDFNNNDSNKSPQKTSTVHEIKASKQENQSIEDDEEDEDQNDDQIGDYEANADQQFDVDADDLPLDNDDDQKVNKQVSNQMEVSHDPPAEQNKNYSQLNPVQDVPENQGTEQAQENTAQLPQSNSKDVNDKQSSQKNVQDNKDVPQQQTQAHILHQTSKTDIAQQVAKIPTESSKNDVPKQSSKNDVGKEQKPDDAKSKSQIDTPEQTTQDVQKQQSQVDVNKQSSKIDVTKQPSQTNATQQQSLTDIPQQQSQDVPTKEISSINTNQQSSKTDVAKQPSKSDIPQQSKDDVPKQSKTDIAKQQSNKAKQQSQFQTDPDQQNQKQDQQFNEPQKSVNNKIEKNEVIQQQNHQPKQQNVNLEDHSKQPAQTQVSNNTNKKQVINQNDDHKIEQSELKDPAETPAVNINQQQQQLNVQDQNGEAPAISGQKVENKVLSDKQIEQQNAQGLNEVQINAGMEPIKPKDEAKQEPVKQSKISLHRVIEQLMKPRQKKLAQNQALEDQSPRPQSQELDCPHQQKLRKSDSLNDKYKDQKVIAKDRLKQQLELFKTNGYKKPKKTPIKSKQTAAPKTEDGVPTTHIVSISPNPKKIQEESEDQTQYTPRTYHKKQLEKRMQALKMEHERFEKLRREQEKKDNIKQIVEADLVTKRKTLVKKPQKVQIKSPDVKIVQQVERKIEVKNDLHSRMRIHNDEKQQKAAIDLVKRMNENRVQSEQKRVKFLEQIQSKISNEIDKFRKQTNNRILQVNGERRKKLLEQMTEHEKIRLEQLMKEQQSALFVKELKQRQQEFGHYSLKQLQEPLMLINEIEDGQQRITDGTNQKLTENQFLIIEEQRKLRKILKQKQLEYSRKVNMEHLPRVQNVKVSIESSRESSKSVKRNQKKAWQIEQELSRKNHNNII